MKLLNILLETQNSSIESSIEEGQFVSTEEQCIEYIGKRSKYNLETIPN